MVLMRGQQRLLGRGFAPQPVTAHFMAIEIDLAPDQPVLPGPIDQELVAQELDLSVLVGEPQVDELAMQRPLPIQRETRGKRTAWRRLRALAGQATLVGLREAPRGRLQRLQVRVVEALPDLLAARAR